MDDTTIATTGPAGVLPRQLAIGVLLVGPLASVAFVVHRFGPSFAPRMLFAAVAVTLLFWSPVWFSVPALLLQDARDAALPEATVADRVLRPFRLVPHLAFSPSSAVRSEMQASLWGFALGVVAAWMLL